MATKAIDRVSPRAAQREQCRRSLAEFAKQAWHVLEPSTPMKWGWALDAICEHLEAVSSGEITRLLMNVPPGSMKSLLTGVLFPAWEWGPLDNPWLRFIGTAHAQHLAIRDNMKCRRLIQSQWYQNRWPIELTTDQNAKTKFENSATGFRECMAFEGMTGSRGDRVLIDDPHSVDGAKSPALLTSGVETFREALPSRVNNDQSAIIIIMQRLHEEDISAVAREFGYDHLCIPMRYEPPGHAPTKIGWTDPRRKDGELMFPDRFPESQVADLEESLGIYGTAGQLQQRPVPRGGGLIKEAWLEPRFRERGEKPIRIIQSWDCASKPAERNDPSACLTFAEFKDRIELWDASVARQEFPDLVRRAKDKHAEFKPNAVLIEDKDSGQQLGQQLKRDSKLPVIMVNPGSLDKVTRMDAETPFLEAKKLLLPESAPWVAPYVAEMISFPAGKHDDQVDATSQALKWLREKRHTGRLPPSPYSLTRVAPRPT